MKLFLSVLLLATAALAAPGQFEPIQLNYHEEVGIPEAARIKAAEEAMDFDGSRIAGGSPSTLGQFPYLGGLVITTHGGQTSVCGSSLLTNTRAVTAAHCWFDGWNNARQLVVVLGSTLLFSGGTRMPSNQVVMHANYNPWNLNNDIAIITINHVAYTNNIRAITSLASGAANFVGQTARAAGFGRTADNVNIGQNQHLSHVDLPVITNAECHRVFGNFVIASTLCTSGAHGRSTCAGDSGGPLTIGNNLIGVTSFGALAGCQRGFPAGFVRVSSFNAWIRQRL